MVAIELRRFVPTDGTTSMLTVGVPLSGASGHVGSVEACAGSHGSHNSGLQDRSTDSAQRHFQ